MAKDTGLGFTLTAVPGSWTGSIQRVDLHNDEIPILDISDLGSSGYVEKMAGDLSDAGEVTLTVFFEGTTALPATGTTGTLTLTDPLASGESSAANYSGTAIVRSVNHGSRAINEVKQAEITLEWDGLTGPTFTPAT